MALKFIGENSELQARYLLEGHPRQWTNESWRKLPLPHTVDEELVERAQEVLSYAYFVGRSTELDAFVYAIYRLIGLRHRQAGRLLRHVEGDSNVTPQYNTSALSTKIRTAAHVATQSDRQLFASWFNGAERPRPFTEMCRHGPGPPKWMLVGSGGTIKCPAGQHNANVTECLAAVREAQPKGSFASLKVVNDGATSGVPHGCLYSSPSKSAMFNLHPGGLNRAGHYRLVCST